jgi:hypothetical protein
MTVLRIKVGRLLLTTATLFLVLLCTFYYTQFKTHDISFGFATHANSQKPASKSDIKTTTEGHVSKLKTKCDSLSAEFNLKNMSKMTLEQCAEFKKYCGVPSCQSMLDMVILWVNGSDPSLMSQIQDYADFIELKGGEGYSKDSMKVNRFRELGQLKYGLRSIEKNLKYARRIFIVTNNQIPSFLNTSHLQIRIISHSDLKPTRTVPLFNSMAIQSMIHTIPTISSPFLYMEDDIYFGQEIKLEYLFKQNKAVMRTSANLKLSDLSDVSNDPLRRSIQRSLGLAKSKGWHYDAFINSEKGIVNFNTHISLVLFPERLQLLWDTFPEVMVNMSRHTFRHLDDPHLWSLYLHSGNLNN